MVVIAPKGRELPYKSNGGNRPGGGGGVYGLPYKSNGGDISWVGNSHIKVMVVVAPGSGNSHIKVTTFRKNWRILEVKIMIIQHIDTLPKYGHKTLDVRISNVECKFRILKGS